MKPPKSPPDPPSDLVPRLRADAPYSPGYGEATILDTLMTMTPVAAAIAAAAAFGVLITPTNAY